MNNSSKMLFYNLNNFKKSVPCGLGKFVKMQFKWCERVYVFSKSSPGLDGTFSISHFSDFSLSLHNIATRTFSRCMVSQFHRLLASCPVLFVSLLCRGKVAGGGGWNGLQVQAHYVYCFTEVYCSARPDAIEFSNPPHPKNDGLNNGLRLSFRYKHFIRYGTSILFISSIYVIPSVVVTRSRSPQETT